VVADHTTPEDQIKREAKANVIRNTANIPGSYAVPVLNIRRRYVSLNNCISCGVFRKIHKFR
jgi:ribosomal protein S26